jgi:hypothetical protein
MIMDRKQSSSRRPARGTIMDRDGQIVSARAALRWNIPEALVNLWQKSSTLAGVLGLLLLGYGGVSLMGEAFQTALLVLVLLILGYSAPSLVRVGMLWYQGEQAE